ncbi:MAG: glycosyltransferase [Ginsengibacter sp.]
MQLEKETIDYSLVISVCNPDERLLKRCLNAIYNLDITGINIEVILVDNNCTSPITNLPYVQEFLRKIPSFKTLIVPAVGLRNARIAAIKETSGKYIVYFDYDNEPEFDYMQELKKLNDLFPQIGAIGAGEVSVDFIDGIDKNIEKYARLAFKERHDTATKFSGLHEWQSCYPFDAGLCVSSSLLKEYANLARDGRFIIPGLNGNQLSIGDDTQMVLLSVNKGYGAGTSPSLKIRQTIPQARSNYKYVQQYVFGAGLSHENCMAQVISEYKEKLSLEIISKSKFFWLTIDKYFKTIFKPDPVKTFDFIEFISMNAGAYIALNKPVPTPIKRLINFLKLAA